MSLTFPLLPPPPTTEDNRFHSQSCVWNSSDVIRNGKCVEIWQMTLCLHPLLAKVFTNSMHHIYVLIFIAPFAKVKIFFLKKSKPIYLNNMHWGRKQYLGKDKTHFSSIFLHMYHRKKCSDSKGWLAYFFIFVEKESANCLTFLVEYFNIENNALFDFHK